MTKMHAIWTAEYARARAAGAGHEHASVRADIALAIATGELSR